MTPIEITQSQIFELVKNMGKWEVARNTKTGFCYLKTWVDKHGFDALYEASKDLNCTVTPLID